MTNDKARDLLLMIEVKEPNELIVNSWWKSFVKDYKGALEMAIKALEQAPCSDAVSRQAVLDLCDRKDPEYKVEHLKEDVECLPSVTPQPKMEEELQWFDIA